MFLFIFIDIFDFDEDMVENEPPGGLPSTASPFPFSSDDDDTDSSSNEGRTWISLWVGAHLTKAQITLTP